MEIKLTLKQKLQLEKPDENVIRLYHEGLFFVAYQESAVRFKQNINPKVKLLRQLNKNGESYLRIGIIQDSPMLHDLNIKDAEGNFLDSLVVECPQAAPVRLDGIEPDRLMQRTPHKAKSESGKTAEADTSAGQAVIEEIRNLTMATLTMADAMSLIVKWNGMLNLNR